MEIVKVDIPKTALAPISLELRLELRKSAIRFNKVYGANKAGEEFYSENKDLLKAVKNIEEALGSIPFYDAFIDELSAILNKEE